MTGGYRRGLVTLRFEGDEYEGLVVRCRRPSIGAILALGAARSTAGGSLAAALEPCLDQIASLIADWNIEDDVTGEPIKISKVGLRSLDPALVLAMVTALISVVSIGAPLGHPSNSGDPALEESIPMEISTGSPPNSSTPG